LRNFVLNEPRGGVFRHVNLLVPPKDPRAQMGFLIMEPADNPPMSGSNSICVATVLLETGILPMEEPETRLVLEAPGGLVEVRARCRDGVVEEVAVTNLPSFAQGVGVPLDVPGLGRSRSTRPSAATASWWWMPPRSASGSCRPSAGIWRNSARASRHAATEAIGFRTRPCPTGATSPSASSRGRWNATGAALSTRHAVAIRPGKIDRSPTGTAVSARMALLAAKGEMAEGDRLTAFSVIDSTFTGRILGRRGSATSTGSCPRSRGAPGSPGRTSTSSPPTIPGRRATASPTPGPAREPRWRSRGFRGGKQRMTDTAFLTRLFDAAVRAADPMPRSPAHLPARPAAGPW
jgi:trans-L-3-hydroxyproline dehydratase